MVSDAARVKALASFLPCARYSINGGYRAGFSEKGAMLRSEADKTTVKLGVWERAGKARSVPLAPVLVSCSCHNTVTQT